MSSIDEPEGGRLRLRIVETLESSAHLQTNEERDKMSILTAVHPYENRQRG